MAQEKDQKISREELFQTHREILTQAAGRTSWRNMPPGGKQAIDAGLVVESDPTWMYSDDHRASNRFTLTELGREIMREQGFVCKCAGCIHQKFGRTVTDREYCRDCKTGIDQYGITEIRGEPSCKMHARMVAAEEAKKG